tara:strand:+ start:1910 stop:2686 length:777 start_codon:yes stop_codon:yes gene_type:complete
MATKKKQAIEINPIDVLNDECNTFNTELVSSGFRVDFTKSNGNADHTHVTFDETITGLKNVGGTADAVVAAKLAHDTNATIITVTLHGITQAIWKVDGMTKERALVLYDSACSMLEKKADISTQAKIGKKKNPKYRGTWTTRKSEERSAQEWVEPLPNESRNKLLERAKMAKLDAENYMKFLHVVEGNKITEKESKEKSLDTDLEDVKETIPTHDNMKGKQHYDAIIASKKLSITALDCGIDYLNKVIMKKEETEEKK